MKEIQFTVGQEIEVPGDFHTLDSWYTAKILETHCISAQNNKKKNKLVIEYDRLTTTTSLTPLRETLDVKKVRPRPPQITQNFYQINQIVDALFANGWWKGRVIGVLKGLSYMVLLDSINLKHREIAVKIDNLRVHRDWVDGEWVTPKFEQHQDIYTTDDRGDAKKTDQAHVCQVGSTSSIATVNNTNTRKRKLGQSCASKAESLISLSKKQATEASHTEIAQHPDKEEASQKKHEAVFSCPPDGLSYPHANHPPHNEEKGQYDFLENQAQCSQMIIDSQSSAYIINSFTTDEIKQQKEGVIKQTPTTSGRTRRQSEEFPLEASVQGAPTKDLIAHSEREVPMQTVSNSSNILPNRQEEASSQKKDEVQTVTDISRRSSEGFDDHHSPFFHQASMSPTHISANRLLGSQANLVTTMREVPLKNHEKQNSSYLVKCSMYNGKREKEIVRQENGNILFTKSYSVWNNLESMEEFRRLSQNPHFRNLENTNEYLREGEAVGYMVSFADLVNWTRRAQLDEPNSVFEENLMALDVLEDAGFDVQRVRTRIKDLLKIKESCVQTGGLLKQCDEKIVKEKLEGEGLEVELGVIDGRISEIEEDIIQMKEKRESVEKERKTKRFRIAGIERKVYEVKEMIQNAKSEFRISAAADW